MLQTLQRQRKYAGVILSDEHTHISNHKLLILKLVPDACWNRSTAHNKDCGQEQHTHLIPLLVAKISRRVCEKCDRLEFVNI